MNHFIELKHHRIMCKFCGEVLNQTECSDRGTVWYEDPPHVCTDVKNLNQLMGSKQIDAHGISDYIKNHQKFFYRDRKIFDSLGNELEVSSLIKEEISCSCGFNGTISFWEKQDFGSGVYACPECGNLKIIK